MRQEGKFTEKAGEIDYKGQRLLLHSKLKSLSNIQVPLNNVAPEMLPSQFGTLFLKSSIFCAFTFCVITADI